MENIFSHYAAAESLYTATVSPVCEKHGLTCTELTVLLFLANNPQLDTASAVVRYRRLAKSHVSLSVRSLQEKGLLRGAYHAPNKRTVHLTVTEAAQAVVADGQAAQRAFGQILFAGFSEAEYAQLTAFIERIDRNVARYTGAQRGEDGQ